MEKACKNEKQIGIILSYITTIASLIIGIIYTPILLRILGQDEYGVYEIVGSIVGYLSLFSLGLDSAYVCFYAKYQKENDIKKVARLNGMFLVIFIFLGFLALAVGVVITLNSKSIIGDKLTVQQLYTAQNLMWLMIINSFVTFPITVFRGITIAHERFIFQKSMQLLSTVANPIIVLLILGYNQKSYSIVIVSICINIILLLSNVFFCIKILKVPFLLKNFDVRLLKTLLIFSGFIFLNMIIDQVNWNVDKMILGRVRGTSEVAVYGVASQVHLVFMQLSTSISSVFVPQVNQIVTRNPYDNDQISKLFIRIGRVQYGILTLIVSGFCFLGQYFVSIWAGHEYDDSYYIILILMVASITPLIQNTGIEILRAKNRHQFRTIVYLFIAVVNIVITIPLSKQFGAVGAAIGTAISLLVGNGFIINIYYYKLGIKIIDFWTEIIKMSKALIIPIVFGVILYKFIVFDFFIEYVFGLLIYSFIFMLSMWKFGMNNMEKDLIVSFFNKRKNI